MLTERQLEYVAAAGRFGAANNARLGAQPNASSRAVSPDLAISWAGARLWLGLQGLLRMSELVTARCM
jgi:hypothetical protein